MLWSAIQCYEQELFCSTKKQSLPEFTAICQCRVDANKLLSDLQIDVSSMLCWCLNLFIHSSRFLLRIICFLKNVLFKQLLLPI